MSLLVLPTPHHLLSYAGHRPMPSGGGQRGERHIPPFGADAGMLADAAPLPRSGACADAAAGSREARPCATKARRQHSSPQDDRRASEERKATDRSNAAAASAA